MRTLRKCLLLLLLLPCLYLIAVAFKGDNRNFLISKHLDVFHAAFRELDMMYVDTLDVAKVIDGGIHAMVSALDPYTVYYPEEEDEDLKMMLTGKYAGVGAVIRYHKKHDRVVIVEPYEGMPALNAGLRAGDILLSIDGEDLKGLAVDKVSEKLRGEPSTQLSVRVKREGVTDSLLEVKLTRANIALPPVPYYALLSDSTGYIILNSFTENCAREVRLAFIDLRNQGARRLVLDLRGNGGGYLDQAVKIADEFLAKDELIVFTNGRYRGRHDYFATSEGVFEEGKIIVLIDEIAASASEIVAGALQDNDRGMIIGRRTFGKGLVQEQKELPDGSALRLTVSRYYTPSGRCIQRPYISGDPEKYYTDFIERYANMEKHTDTISHADSLKYKTKKGRIVYGGGGIEPDVELPYYVYKKSDYYSTLLKKGLIYKFCFDHIDRNRKAFKQYKDGADFLNKFSVTENLLQEMLSFATEQKVEKENLSDTESSEIKQLMKSYIAQNLYGDEYFYPLFLLVDEDVQKALPYFKK
jgi:carboxyl-terminal processing protease